jgi:DNA-binding XRE family transcriptional regulator
VVKIKKERTYSLYTKQAAILLGQHIQLGRKERKWTEANLADRAGINRQTLRKIEKGDLNISLGFAFEVATILGIKLFDTEPARLAMSIDRLDDKIAIEVRGHYSLGPGLKSLVEYVTVLQMLRGGVS